MRIEYHRTLIADGVRNAAFERALRSVIRSGETTVADIGAGTGLLGLLAMRLGAREVFLYETAEVAGVAARILKSNGARNCHLIPCHSTEMQDPPPVDVVVSETLGNFALEEGIVATMNDARRRFLKKGGVLIPGRITQFVAPVVSDRIHAELSVWDRVGSGLDLTVAKTMSLNNAYVRRLAPGELLDVGRSAIAWDEVDFARENKTSRRGEAKWTPARGATVFGFAVWWSAELVPGVMLATAPDAPRTHWEQLYLPLLSPIKAGAGETVQIALRTRTSAEAGTDIAWTVTRSDRAGRQLERQALDLAKGYLP